MKKRISITACRHAILITERGYEPGIPLEIDGEERMITEIDIQVGRWYSVDHCITRRRQEQVTDLALAIIERNRGPRTPPTVSIRECQEAIRIVGGIKIALRGEERLITEIRTHGAGNSQWFSGDLRFTLTEKERLTRLARAIIEDTQKTSGNYRYRICNRENPILVLLLTALGLVIPVAGQ